MNSISSRNSSLLSIEVGINHMSSLEKKTIREHHSPGNPFQDNRPLTKGGNEKFYPKNLINSYVIRFTDEFCVYLGCGSVDHIFRSCPFKASKDMTHFF